jgi:hypothetical protein
MIVTVKWGVGLRQRILIEHSLVGFNHLFNVMLRRDAKVVAIAHFYKKSYQDGNQLAQYLSI